MEQIFLLTGLITGFILSARGDIPTLTKGLKMRVSAFRIGAVLLLIFIFSLPCGKAENLKGKVGLSGGLGPCIGITGIADTYDDYVERGGVHLGGSLEYFLNEKVSLGSSCFYNGFLRSSKPVFISLNHTRGSTLDTEVGWDDYAWLSFGVFGKLFLRENIKSSPYLKTEVTFNRPKLIKYAKFGFNGGAGYRFAGMNTGTFFTELMFNSVFKKKTLTYFTLSAGICFYLN
ncbi:MAG: hypothetical protein MUO85_09190 [candidate division Zixibacteria bacterium]|nr:hypothetical protein [candidate division Zixibacteria bacterium]